MDISSTRGWTDSMIEESIAETEASYPSINNKIRLIIANYAYAYRMVVARPSLDFNAALISNCRQDPLYCGKCAFWAAFRRAGLGWDHENNCVIEVDIVLKRTILMKWGKVSWSPTHQLQEVCAKGAEKETEILMIDKAKSMGINEPPDSIDSWEIVETR